MGALSNPHLCYKLQNAIWNDWPSGCQPLPAYHHRRDICNPSLHTVGGPIHHNQNSSHDHQDRLPDSRTLPEPLLPRGNTLYRNLERLIQMCRFSLCVRICKLPQPLVDVQVQGDVLDRTSLTKFVIITKVFELSIH